MWKYISGVPKVVEEKKKEKNPKAACDSKGSKEYEKNRSRKFSAKWQVGLPWLQHDQDKGMICKWCIENKATLMAQNDSARFIDGCTSYKAESIAYHEKCAAHLLAQQCHKAKIHPEKTPANLARQQMLKQYTGKLRLLFRNAHAVSKNKKSLADYRWLCDLDEVKGLAIGATYRNSKACGTFTKYIATAAQSQVAEELTNAKFVSVTSDGATDSSITEQEIVFVRYSSKGVPFTKFVGLKQPISPNASGLHKAIMAALGDVGLGEEDLKKKVVGFGCDGASVMVGKKRGVSAFLTQLQPSCITVHCFAHRLELAYKDAVKENKLYDSCIALLMGLYYFYHNSPKQRQNLKRSFQSLNQSSVMPTRVGGTRWVGHIILVVENFLKGYQAIRAQLEDCISKKVSKIIVYLVCVCKTY